MQRFIAAELEPTTGKGALSGDLANEGGTAASSSAASPTRNSAKISVGDMQGDYALHKEHVGNIHGVFRGMKTMQDAGQPINDVRLHRKMTKGSATADPERNRSEGFDPSNLDGTWDTVDVKARFYKTKLKMMNYDGTAFLEFCMPDVTVDAPLDMRATIREITPHVKDDGKTLTSLPGELL